MGLDGNVRLDQALALLGYKEEIQPSHYRSNLLHAVMMFAGLTHDEPLELACQARLNLIQAENETARGSD